MPRPSKKDSTTEERILDAARRIFVRKGMYGARMQDIADEAGINKALLHYYFRNKDQLFEMIFRQAGERLFPTINRIFSANMPLFDKIEMFCEEYISVILQNPHLPAFVLNEINRDPALFLERFWTQGTQPHPHAFLAQVAEEVRNGTIRPVHPLHLLLNLLSMCMFPFIGRPVIQHNLGLNEEQFRALMEQRKKEIPRFIIAAIRA